MMPVYQQPVMMAQPMMMAPQPMMQQQQFQQQQQPQIIINNNDDDGDCPQCKKGVMIAEKTCSCKTCFLCLMCPCFLLADCAWGTKRKCLSCGYDVDI